MFRFIHSSDLHLGKRFGNLPEDLGSRLREARHKMISCLADKARGEGAGTILLAGDTFDTETPSPPVLRQALAAMASDPSIRWIILPGNHDSLQAEELWKSIRHVLPENVTLATESVPLEIGKGVIVLPSPCTTRRPGRDLTEWMQNASTPTDALRIGLAHGSVQSFSEDSGSSNVIAPDRALRANLDYLALGDWHGPVSINERTFYSGAPEQDRFKHVGPGTALLVSIEAKGAVPLTTTIKTGSFVWNILELGILPGQDAVAELESQLQLKGERRQHLINLRLSGRIKVTERLALITKIAQLTPEFARVDLNDLLLKIECETDDLNLIDHSGALRQAAETLLCNSNDERLALGEREAARSALMLLFSYCSEMPV